MIALTYIPFYAVQVVSILFSITLAIQNSPAVNLLERHGETGKEMATLHKFNVWVKLFFCLGMAIAGSNWVYRVEYFIISGLWVYLLFDPVLNVSRFPKRKWNYLGSNDSDGKFWKRIFNAAAGEWKALILSLAIIAANILIFFI